MSENNDQTLINRLKEKLQKEPELIPHPPTFPATPLVDDYSGLRTLMKETVDTMEAEAFRDLFSHVFGLHETMNQKLDNHVAELKKTTRRLWYLLGACVGSFITGLNAETILFYGMEFLKFLAQG